MDSEYSVKKGLSTKAIEKQLKQGETTAFRQKGEKYVQSKKELPSPTLLKLNNVQKQNIVNEQLKVMLSQQTAIANHRELLEQLLKQSDLDADTIKELSEYANVLVTQLNECYVIIGELTEELEKTDEQANKLDELVQGQGKELDNQDKIIQKLKIQQGNVDKLEREHIKMRKEFNNFSV